MEQNALYAVMVLCARDVDKIFDGMRAANDVAGDPTLPAAPGNTFAYLTGQYWTPLGQVRCDDNFVDKGVNCYFGLLLECRVAFGPFAQGDFMVAVRGTVTPDEWVDDALSEFPDLTSGNVGGVGSGFWGLYSTMTFAGMDRSNVQADPAQAIVNRVKAPDGSPRVLWIVGHSLGSALATYLTADIQKLLAGTSVQPKPYFFASPRPGTQDYADNYQATVPAYDLVNYVSDVVPNVPSTPPFYTLNSGGATHNVHIIPVGPSSPKAELDFLTNLANYHSPVNYARLLDPTNQVAQNLPL